MGKRSKNNVMYFLALGYYALGLTDANGKPLMYQREKIRLKDLGEYLQVKKQLEEGKERIIYHPYDGVSSDQVCVIHHHQPLAEITCFEEMAPTNVIIPADVGKILAGRVP